MVKGRLCQTITVEFWVLGIKIVKIVTSLLELH